MNIKRRNWILCAVACCLAGAASGAKLSKSVPSGWDENFAQAKVDAEKDGKLILLAFSGSDWCHWCMKMAEEIYSDRKFIDKAKQKFVLIMIDKPRDQSILSKKALKQNPQLREKYAIRGYPCTVIVRPSGEEVKRFGGYQPGGVDKFLAKLDEVAQEAGISGGNDAARDAEGDEEVLKDDRFFGDSRDKAKIAAREARQRKVNSTNDLELASFAGITLGADKADGNPVVKEPFLLLSDVQKPVYARGKLTGFVLAAPAKRIKELSAKDFRIETCRLVRAIEKELDIQFAVTSFKIDFVGKNAAITVSANQSTGQLAVQFVKKK